MESLTIHNLDDATLARIREIAGARGVSVDAAARELLARAAAATQPSRTEESTGFGEFCGLWTEEEAKAFDEAVGDFEEIDPREWR